MGYIPTVKRTNHNWGYNSPSLASPAQVKILVEQHGYTEEKAKQITRLQAGMVISALRRR